MNLQRGNMKNPHDGVLYLIVSRLYQCRFLGCDIVLQFARCYHWGKLAKGYMDLSILFLANICESTTISKFKKIN